MKTRHRHRQALAALCLLVSPLQPFSLSAPSSVPAPTENSAGSAAQPRMNHQIRANELLADAAERASVAAWLLGAAPYPHEKLNAARQLIPRSQSHDTLPALPGASTPETREHALRNDALCMNLLSEILTAAVGAVASGLDTTIPDDDPTTIPLVIYNPLSTAREDIVEASAILPDNDTYTMPVPQVFDADGHPVPTQPLTIDHDAHRFRFLAKTPPVGFAVYFVKRSNPIATYNEGSDWQALRMEQPLLAFTTTPHEGKLGRSFSLPITPITPMTPIPIHFQKHQLRTLALTPAAPLAKLPPATSTPITLPCNANVIAHRGAAATGSAGSTIPAEMLPDTITAEGITFKIAPHSKTAAAQPNALRCEGQTIPLPAGHYNRVYLLAATADAAGTTAPFAVGDDTTMLKIQNWTGCIKRDPVAWFCDHRHDKTGATIIYSYCYLFKYALPVPPGAKTITLPNAPAISVLAITAALDPAAGTRPARPLDDDFTNRPPIVLPAGWANSN